MYGCAPGGGSSTSSVNLVRKVPIGAMQHGDSLDKIDTYLRWYDVKTISNNINGLVEGFPAMFYAVAIEPSGLG